MAKPAKKAKKASASPAKKKRKTTATAKKTARKARGRSENRAQERDTQESRIHPQAARDESRDTRYRPQPGSSMHYDDRDYNRTPYREDDARRMERRRPSQDDYTYDRGVRNDDDRYDDPRYAGRRGGRAAGGYYDDDMRRDEPSYDEGYSYHPYGDEYSRQRQQRGGDREREREAFDEPAGRQRSVPRGRDNMYGYNTYQGRGNRIRDR